MDYQKKSPFEFTVDDLDRELIARTTHDPGIKPFTFDGSIATPAREETEKQLKELYDPAKVPLPDKALEHISTAELVKIILYKIGRIEIGGVRGIWGKDTRQDVYDIDDEKARENADCVAAICTKNELKDAGNGTSTLRTRNFGETFRLHMSEPFRCQPIAAGRLCTGFLVAEDIIATAGHCACEKSLADLRFFFGYKMKDACRPEIEIANDNIYRGVEIISHAYNRKCIGEDWALVKLDRKVKGQTIAKLSRGDIFSDQPAYALGHPGGLPLKYGPGAKVRNIDNTHFGADLDIFAGNSGSPVFNGNTHEVIGIVVKGDTLDFRQTEEGLMSMTYQHSDEDSQSRPQCTRVSQFIDIVNKL